jgi:hypothetical protein
MPQQKSKNTNGKRSDNPWAELDALILGDEEPTGEEWFTPLSYSERTGLGATASARAIGRLMAEGRLEVWTGIATKTRRKTTKYKLIPRP